MATRETLLALFEKNKGFYISGEYIAQTLGVSRTAVWKAVKKLRDEGYDIEAVTNRGYCLSPDTDIMSADGIKEYLNDYYRKVANIEVFRSVDSTNNICRQRASEGVRSGYIAVACSQSSGRGRRGRTFYSPADTGVYISFLLTPADIHGEEIAKVTTISAVAVCKAIEKFTDKKPSIKWVNDIFVDGRKVCGILSEALYDLEDAKIQSVVVGIGINLYPPKNGFPDSLADTAGSLLDAPGNFSRNQFVAEILTSFTDYYIHENPLEYVEEYRKRSFVIGKDIDIISGKKIRRAHALAINDDCSLKVRFDDGEVQDLKSGEISIRVAE